jgi:hypothetical protein
MSRLIISLSVVLVAWVFLAGCASHTVRPQEVDVPRWALGTLPGTIGVHYSEALRSYVLPEPPDEFLLGESTVALVDDQLEQMFARRVDIAELPTAASSNAEVDAVLDMDIGAAVFWFGNCTPQRPDVFKVAYEIKLLSPAGVTLSSWRTTGIGSHFCGGKLDVRWPRAQIAMRLALQDAVANLSNQLLPQFEDGSLLGVSQPGGATAE